MNHGLVLGAVIDLAGALVLAALGVWLLWLKPRRRTTLLLAAFALTMGTGYVLRNVAGLLLGTEASVGHPVTQMAAALLVAAAVFLVPLATRLPRSMDRAERRLLALPAVVSGFLLLFNAIWRVGGVFDVAAIAQVYVTDFGAAQTLLLYAFLFALLLLPLRAHRWTEDADAGPRLRQTVLAAAALTLFPGLWFGVSSLPHFLAAAALAAALWLRVVTRAPAGNEGAWTARRGARNVALLSLFVPLVGVVLARGLGRDAVLSSGAFGAARTLTVLVLAWAILRHQLLGIDVTVRWSISKTTLAAIFVAVFFVVSEGAQELFATEAGLGPWLGILAAGALLFALAPLQRLTDRLADAAVPGARDPGELDDDERLAIYRDQVRAAWRDGTLTPDERLLLDALRDRLGLGREAAADVESEVAEGAAGGG